MEYTVKALADLAGVTPRTLRWYDRIGLLKPLRTTEAGYRLYGPAQLDRLQDIGDAVGQQVILIVGVPPIALDVDDRLMIAVAQRDVKSSPIH